MRFRTVLIAGARGNLAREIVRAAPDGCALFPLARADLDITNEGAVRTALDAFRPDLVINGAAYNLVDVAESEAETALRINAFGPAILARECAARGISLLHFSTDFVFDGKKQSPYLETDATRPLGVYGASKLAGENIVLAASPVNFVVRVCRLFGPAEAFSGKPSGNFPSLMLKLARESNSVRVVNDQVGSPTYTSDLARAIWQLLAFADGGLFQLSNAGETSFADLARETFRLAGVACEVEGISSEEYGAAARRPKYSTMNNSKAHGCGVIALRDWREALEEFIQSNAL